MKQYTPPHLPNSLVAELHDDIAVLRLAQPARRNAISIETAKGIDVFFATLPEEANAVVICGEGDHFCAGLDLSTVTDLDTAALLSASRLAHQICDRIEHGRCPVIVAMHGAVIGGGLELAAAAHIRVAERGTYYGLPEGMRGIALGGGGTVRLPKLIGLPRVMDMIMTGRTYDAAEGVALGFSQYLAEPGQGYAMAMALARKAAANAPLTNLALTEGLSRIAFADPEIGLLTESLLFALSASSEEAKVRVNDFFANRAAKVQRSQPLHVEQR